MSELTQNQEQPMLTVALYYNRNEGHWMFVFEVHENEGRINQPKGDLLLA